MEEMKTEIITPLTTEPSKEVYVPSSTEKKRAVMMYVLIGIIVMAFNNQKKSDFEQFHLKQSMGWWSVFLLLVVATSILMFIPYIKYIPILLVVIMIAFLTIFIKNARDGKYTIAQENKLAIFVGLGEWITTLFEIKQENTPTPIDKTWETNQNEVPQDGIQK